MSSVEATSLTIAEKSVLESFSDGVAVLDREWQLTYINRQQAEWFNVLVDEATGRVIWEVCPEWTAFQSPLRQAIIDQIPIQLEYCCSRQKWFELRVSPSAAGLTILTIEITERKRTELALQESEFQFQAFMKHNPASAWIANEVGQILYLNPIYFEIFAVDQNAIGKHIADIFPSETAQQFLENNRYVFETGNVLQTVEYVSDANGNIRSFLVCKFPIVHESGEKLLGGFAVDISEQKRTEAVLQEREQHLKIALGTAKLGSWQHDLMTNVLTCSEQCKANFGLPADAEFTHEILFAALHPEDRERVQAAIQRSIEEHIDYEVEERCFHPDGSLHWLIARGGLVCDDNGNPLRLVGVTLDITERKQLEESLKAANQRISSILASITDAFVTFDQDWHYIYVNQEAARLIGKPSEEILGKRWQELFPEQAEQGTIFTRQFERAMTERITVRCEGFSPAVNRWLEASIFPANPGVSVFFRDISDRKQEEQRKALQYSVSQILAEATTLADVAHTLLQTLCETLGWQVGAIWGIDRMDSVLHCLNIWTASEVRTQPFIEASQQTTFAWGIGLPGRIWSHCQPVWIPDLLQDTNFPRLAAAATAELRAGFGFPILLGDEFFGVIECFCDRSQEPDEDLLQLMTAIGRQIGQFMERKRTESALQESEELFQSFMNHSPIGAFIKDESGRYVYVNAFVERLFNRPASELIGNTDFDWFPTEAIEQIRANDRAVIASNEIIEFLESVPFGGQIRHFVAFKFPLHDAAGRRLLGGVSTDITDRVQAEALLRQREEELRIITNTVPALISFVDAEQRYRFNSQCYQDWFGRSPDEIQGQYVWEVLGEAAYTAICVYVEQALLGQTVTFESQVPYQDGGTRYVSASYIPQFDEQGCVTGFVALISDISDRKQQEEALRASAERLSLALTASKMGDWSWDAATDIVTFSQQASAIFDVQPGLNLTWTELRQQLHNEDQQKAQAAVQRAVNEHIDYDIEYRVATADKTYRWIAAKGRAQYDSSGKVLGMLGVVQDITDRKQAEQERERLLAREQAAREQAETANRLKDEFLAVLSHELRSPLNPILGWTKLLRSREFDPPARDRALEVIERNAKLQAQLIEDLLDVSRILQGKLLLKTQPVNLATVVDGAIETVRLAAEAKEIAVQKRLQDTVCVTGDAGRLQQVIWNLLTNAVKFTPNGGQVEVTLQRLAGEAWIQVKDTGKGIASSFLSHVFDAFRQEDSTTTRKFGGLGLGLAIVRYLTELHGGSVEVDSAGENLGTTFTIRLPLLEYQESAGYPQQNANQNRAERSPLANLRILAVDDEADMRDLLEAILTQPGAEVEVVSSAQAVLAAFERGIPDILISDIGMPDMDGYMLMRQIRGRSPEQGGLVPAIALTAYAGEINQQQAQMAGFQQHIAKPVEPEDLVKVIVTLIATRSSA